jgi:hypothetical protein
LRIQRKGQRNIAVSLIGITTGKFLGDLGFEPVRMVAIDEDGSALKFRKEKHIKTLTRNPDWIMSKEGKKK